LGHALTLEDSVGPENLRSASEVFPAETPTRKLAEGPWSHCGLRTSIRPVSSDRKGDLQLNPRSRVALLIALVVGVLVVALGGGVARAGEGTQLPAGVPTTGPAGEAYVDLWTARDALATQAEAFADPYPRAYVNYAVANLNDALDPLRWNTGGLALSATGSQALASMRMAAGWLAWADSSVNEATVGQQRNILYAMGLVARARFTDVFHFIGEGSGPDPWTLWAAEYYLNAGDAALAGAPDATIMHASLYYTYAWQTLLGQPPCC
jgi:hypothetical protein